MVSTWYSLGMQEPFFEWFVIIVQTVVNLGVL